MADDLKGLVAKATKVPMHFGLARGADKDPPTLVLNALRAVASGDVKKAAPKGTQLCLGRTEPQKGLILFIVTSGTGSASLKKVLTDAIRAGGVTTVPKLEVITQAKLDERGDEVEADAGADAPPGAAPPAAPPAKSIPPAPPAPAPPKAAAPTAPRPAPPAREAPKVAYTKTRLEWDTARKQAHQNLQALQNALRTKMPTQADLAAELDVVLEQFDDSLLGVLDDALNATDEGERRGFEKEALDLIQEYLEELAGNKLVKHVDANPLVKTNLEDTLGRTLAQMRTRLEALAAG